MIERNISLDYFKLLLSVLVLCIHLKPSSDLAEIILGNGISRIAVPCFFLINGYFFAFIINKKEQVKRMIMRVFLLYIVWSMVYLGFYIDYLNFSNRQEWFISIGCFLLGYGHLWYVAALLPSLVLLFLCHKQNKYILLFVALMLYVIGYILSIYPVWNNISTHIVSQLMVTIINYKQFLLRNFFFIGFPFVCIGYCLQNYSINIKKGFFIISLFIIILLLVFESFLLNENSLTPDFRIVLIILCPLILLFFIKYPILRTENGEISKLSSAVYFIHPLVLSSMAQDYSTYRYLFSILLIVLILGVGLIVVNKKIKIFL